MKRSNAFIDYIEDNQSEMNFNRNRKIASKPATASTSPVIEVSEERTVEEIAMPERKLVPKKPTSLLSYLFSPRRSNKVFIAPVADNVEMVTQSIIMRDANILLDVNTVTVVSVPMDVEENEEDAIEPEMESHNTPMSV
jgi:hypothetical protein